MQEVIIIVIIIISYLFDEATKLGPGVPSYTLLVPYNVSLFHDFRENNNLFNGSPVPDDNVRAGRIVDSRQQKL